MIINDKYLDKAEFELKRAILDFHFSMGKWYDITIISENDEKLKDSKFSEMIANGKGTMIAVNRGAWKYRENKDILKVIGWTIENNPGLNVIKKEAENFDLFFFTFENEMNENIELNKPKKVLIKKKKKDETN